VRAFLTPGVLAGLRGQSLKGVRTYDSTNVRAGSRFGLRRARVLSYIRTLVRSYSLEGIPAS